MRKKIYLCFSPKHIKNIIKEHTPSYRSWYYLNETIEINSKNSTYFTNFYKILQFFHSWTFIIKPLLNETFPFLLIICFFVSFFSISFLDPIFQSFRVLIVKAKRNQIKMENSFFQIFPLHVFIIYWVNFPWWYTLHICQVILSFPHIVWSINLHYLLKIHLKSQDQYLHEKIYSSHLNLDIVVEYERTYKDIFWYYENRGIILPWCMSQIGKICIISKII